MSDIGLTHIALPVTKVDKSVAFYAKYAQMQIVHRRKDESPGSDVVWLSDRTRPFVIVLIGTEKVENALLPLAHLGVGCESRAEVDRLCAEARSEGALKLGPHDSGYPVGYWAFISDPDGHTLEISYGQEVALTVQQTT
jgi:catechol 2,3-dioxygenase-like lactoylglutathione lyase family enzyme